MRLGELLMAMGAITEAQLIEALSAQLVTGGRLGSKLLQLEYVDIVTLTKALAHKHNVRGATPDMLFGISPQILAVMPKEAAAKCQAVPLGMMKNKSLGVAFVDPTNLATIDQVRFATGYKVTVFVAAELLIARILERFYGVPVPLGLQERPQVKKDETAQPVRGAPGIRKESRPQKGAVPESSFGEQTALPAVEIRANTGLALNAAPQQQPRYLTQPPKQQAYVPPPPAEVYAPPVQRAPADPFAATPMSSLRRQLTPEERQLIESAFHMQVDTASVEAAFDGESEFAVDVDVEESMHDRPLPAELAPPPPPPVFELLEPDAVVVALAEVALPADAPPRPARPTARPTPTEEALDAGWAEDVPLAPDAVPEPVSLDDALKAFEQPASLDTVAQVISDHLRAQFAIGLVLKVKKELATGWQGFAPGCDQERIESILLPLGPSSAFQMANSKKSVFRGAPPASGSAVQKPLFKLLKCEAPGELVVCPLVAGPRVVLLVIGAAPKNELPKSFDHDLALLRQGAEEAIRGLILKDRNKREEA